MYRTRSRAPNLTSCDHFLLDWCSANIGCCFPRQVAIANPVPKLRQSNPLQPRPKPLLPARRRGFIRRVGQHDRSQALRRLGQYPLAHRRPKPLPAATLHGVCRHRPQAALYRRQLRKPQGPLHKSLYHAPPGIGVPSTALLQRMLATINSYYGVFSHAHTKDVAAFGDSRSRCPQTAPTEVSAMLPCALTARFPVRHLLVALKNMHAGPHCKK